MSHDDIIKKIIEKALSEISSDSPPRYTDTRVKVINIIEEEVCPLCKKELEYDDVLLAVFKRGTDYAHRHILIKLFYCPKCRIHYATKSLRDKIAYQAYPLIVEENADISKLKKASESIKADGNDMRENELSEGIKPDSYYDHLNEESDLKKLGYQITGMSTEDRWKILISKAVPKLGVERTIAIIENNIRIRERQKNGSIKYSRAIAAWRYDIKRLKVYYNK